MSVGNVGYSEGRQAPASIKRELGHKYRWLVDGKTYEQIDTGVSNNWVEVEGSSSGSYKALVTQTFTALYAGPLVVGRTYTVTFLEAGDDFTGSGYVSDNVPFVAVGQPAVWTNGTEAVDVEASSPSVIELENSVGPIDVVYNIATGIEFQSNGLFLADKTFYNSNLIGRVDDDTMVYSGVDITNLPVEITVYN